MSRVAGRRVVSPALVGRADELARLLSAVSAPPALVVLDGEAGIGKTRLVSELLAHPEARARQRLVGRCHGIRESFPLGPMIEAVRGLGEDLANCSLSPVAGALRPLLPEIAHLLPSAPEPLDDRAAERHRVFRGFLSVLDAVGPAVLILEDLHWADEQTTDFVAYLLADPPANVAVVLTFRGDELAPQVRAMTAKLPASTLRADIQLAPLDARETGELASAIMGVERVSDEFAAYLCERASGIPFAIEELLALLRAQGKLVWRGSGWARRALDELDVPAGIRDSVLERTSRLSEAARVIAEAAAVLQVPVGVPILAATASVEGGRAADGLTEALESGLLAEDGIAIGFRHLLAAQAVYESIPGLRRRELHSRAVASLETLRQPPLGQLAHHLFHAGRLDEWAVAAERAADQAIALGNDAEAVRLLEAVLRQANLDGQRRGEIALTLGRAAIEAFRARDVAELVADVLGGDVPGSVRGELRFQLGLLLHETGAEPERQRRLFADAVAELDHRPDLQAWAMVVLGIPMTPGVSLDEHRSWLERALEIVPSVGDPAFEVFLLGKIAMVLVPIGDPRGRDLIGRIIGQTRGAPRHRREVNAFWSVGTEACYAGDHESARRLLTSGLAGARMCHSSRLELSIRSALAVLDFSRGAWDGLDQVVEALVDELDEHPRSRIDVETVAGCLAAARGDADTAERRLRGVVDLIVDLGGFDLLPIPLGALIRLLSERGDHASAVDYVDRLLGLLDRTQVWAPGARALPPMTAALIRAGRVGDARALVERCATRLRDLDAPLGPAAVMHARGFATAEGGDWQAAADLFNAAAEGYEPLHCTYEAALAREHAAATIWAAHGPGGQGSARTEGEQARAEHAPEPLLQSALDAYRRLGASRDAARATQIARQHGMAVRPRQRGGRRAYGTALSPREREVAELAAVGRTNKEIAQELFLSVNTVSRHVTAAKRKLDVRTRSGITHRLAELAAAGSDEN